MQEAKATTSHFMSILEGDRKHMVIPQEDSAKPGPLVLVDYESVSGIVVNVVRVLSRTVETLTESDARECGVEISTLRDEAHTDSFTIVVFEYKDVLESIFEQVHPENV